MNNDAIVLESSGQQNSIGTEVLDTGQETGMVTVMDARRGGGGGHPGNKFNIWGGLFATFSLWGGGGSAFLLRFSPYRGLFTMWGLLQYPFLHVGGLFVLMKGLFWASTPTGAHGCSEINCLWQNVRPVPRRWRHEALPCTCLGGGVVCQEALPGTCPGGAGARKPCHA